MARLIAAIIRHGDYRQRPDTPSAHQPFPLTAKGEAQAIQAAGTLRQTINQHGWTLDSEVDSSQLLRAWQTARLISDELADLFPKPAQLKCFDALAERGVGSAANLNIDEIEAIIREDPRFPELPDNWKSNSHFCLPLQGAESLIDAGARVASHMQQQMEAQAKQANTDTLKLFVGHGAAFRHAAHHLGLLAFEQIAQLSMYHAQPIYLEYLTDKRWQHIGGDWKQRNTHSKFSD